MSGTRGWPYKTDEAGRPRRFLSHREAALWVVSRWERSASPAVLFAALAPLFRPSFGTRVADRLWWVVFSAGTICFVGLLSAGVMHLYGALVGGAMDRGETGFYRSS